nr:hypothetical protein [Tanacetum cinerariifolium]
MGETCPKKVVTTLVGNDTNVTNDGFQKPKAPNVGSNGNTSTHGVTNPKAGPSKNTNDDALLITKGINARQQDTGKKKISNIVSPNPFAALGVDEDKEKEVENIWDESENLNLHNTGASTLTHMVVNEINLSVCAILESHVDVTTVYDTCKKICSRYARLIRNRPWILLGDFNATLNLKDHSAGGYEPNAAMREFKSMSKLWRIMGNLQFNDAFPGSFANHTVSQIIRLVFFVSQRDPSSSILREEHAHYLLAFKAAQLDEERFLKQKAKIEWLKAGDSNTAYFHKIVRSKCTRNRIEMVSDASNNIYDGNQVLGAFVNHYNQFLGAECVTIPLDDHDLFTRVLDDAKADFMVRDVSNDEVKSVIFSIGDDRAHGPDGFTAAFFKKTWDVVGGDINCAIRDFFSNGPLTLYVLMETCMVGLKRRVCDSDEFQYHHLCEQQRIINLCFANDLFLFSRGNPSLVDVIMDALEEFKHVLGLVPIIPKSTAFFCNVPNAIKAYILNFMPFAEGVLLVRYLGVPLISSRLLYRDSKLLVEKLKSIVNDWRNKFLSFAGRLQLIQSVLSSMHIYWAFVFILPNHIVHDLEQLMRGFMWCQGKMKKRIAKVAWDSICMPKHEGDLESLYGLNGFIRISLKVVFSEDVPCRGDVSWGWRKLLQIRSIIRPFIWHKINNGKSTSVCFNRWDDVCPLKDMFFNRDIARLGFSLDDSVNNFISDGVWRWPLDWLSRFSIMAQVQVPYDVILWHDRDGVLRPFSKLKTQDRLQQWDIGSSIDLNLLRRPLCDLVPDSHDHLFFECAFSSQAWSVICVFCDMDSIPPRLIDVTTFIIPISKGKTAVSILFRLVLAATSYYIWLERNVRLFKKKTSSPDQIVDVIISMVRLKLVTFKFKNMSTRSRLLLDQWKIPNYCIVHDGSSR